MPNDIIDNRSTLLLDQIRSILPGSNSARFAVGYFFLSGLESISDVLENISEIRLLIGNITNRQTIEQIAEGYRRLEQAIDVAESESYPKRSDLRQRLNLTQDIIGESISAMDQTDQGEKLISILVDLITEKRLKVRVYNKGRLHSKAYIFDYGQIYDSLGKPIPRQEKGIAIVGSSNFTLSGLTHNSELNVLIHGNDNHDELTDWFNNLWEDSQEFDQYLIDELEQSWPLSKVTPYEIYLKTLYELVKDRIDDETALEFLWQTEITATLTDFQKNAVRRAVQLIRQYSGCFISDVVGLGKSYIGAAIIKHFERHDRSRALIICPASLVSMWEHYNEAYQLNARVLSMGMLREDRLDTGLNLLLEDEKYSDRDFILVDESHNFRKSDTQRYSLLQEYLQSGDRRCVFLTATPRNRDIWDIYNQIKLFHPDDRTQLPIDPPNLKKYLNFVESGDRTVAILLSNIMVRRTRMDVLRWYGFDSETHEKVDPFNYAPYRRGTKRAYIEVAGNPQYFPKRHLKTIDYNINDTYDGIYDKLLSYIGKPGAPPGEEIDQLSYARYGLWNYVLKEKREKSPYNDLHRAGINLRGLMRISLFKRFESSVEAFRSTIHRLIVSHRAFLIALNEDIIPAGEKASDLLTDSDQMDERVFVDLLSQVSDRYLIEDFNSSLLREDIQHDLIILEKMYSLVEPITPDEDDKLVTLKEWLFSSKNDKEPLITNKCLIFTQYADTARYLYNNLNGESDPTIESIYGSDKDKSLVAGRFAPKANPKHAPKGDFTELNLVISTDVLSEGLNLQDCDHVINYDLHWNPVRLIQRFGRIDRIGTEHDDIYGFNFLPEAALDKGLGLKERLQYRIQEIHNSLGEDAAILDPSESLNEEAFIAIYQGRNIDQFEDYDDENLVDLFEAEEFIRQLKENDPDLFNRIISLRDGVRSARANDQSGAIVVCRASNYRQLYLTDEYGEILSREIPHVLGLLKCEPDTPSVNLPAGHNHRVFDIQKSFASEVDSRQAEQKHAVSLTRAQRYILRELRKLYDLAENEDLKSQIELLDQAFRLPMTQAIRQEMNAIQKSRIEGLALFDTLDRIYLRHDLMKRKSQNQLTFEGDQTPIIVCSLGLA